MYGWIYIVPLYLGRIQGYNAEQIGSVLIWIGLPQLLILPLMPKVMKRIEPRLLVTVGFALFIAGSLLAANLSTNFSGPQFLASSLVRAVAQSLVMTPLSATAVAGIEREYAGSASALFNMVRNLGGAIGIALIQTFLTNRDKFHSDILTAQVSLLNNATRTRLNGLTDTIMRHGVSDPGFALHEAMAMVGRSIHQQAMILAVSDTIILQSALLGLALFAVLLLKKAKTGSAGEAH
jgi:DHA2 family multidrug resistance protein